MKTYSKHLKIIAACAISFVTLAGCASQPTPEKQPNKCPTIKALDPWVVQAGKLDLMKTFNKLFKSYDPVSKSKAKP